MRFEIKDSIQTEEYQNALRSYPPDFQEGAFWLEITGLADYNL